MTADPGPSLSSIGLVRRLVAGDGVFDGAADEGDAAEGGAEDEGGGDEDEDEVGHDRPPRESSVVAA